MSPRSFFVILLKLMGIFMIKEFFAMLDISSGNLYYFLGTFREIGAGDWYVAIVVLAIAATLFLTWMLLFRTSVIIDKLRLDEDFYEERFSFNIDQVGVVKIAVLAVAIYMLAEQLPLLCGYAAQYYSHSHNDGKDAMPYPQDVIACFAKIVVAGLLIHEHKLLARYIVGRSNVDNNEVTDG